MSREGELKMPDVMKLNMEELIEFDKGLQGDDRTEEMIRRIILRKIILDMEEDMSREEDYR